MGTLTPIGPLHRAIVVVDIEGSTTRTNTAKARLRQVMYSLLEAAMRTSGIAEGHHDELVDRGDGALLLIHPVDEVPKTLLLSAFLPKLAELLAEHNRRPPADRLRLRAAVHAGEVHFDPKGPFGEAVDIACRLLDAQELRNKLSKTTASLVLVVSDHIYQTVVRHGYDGIDDRAYKPLVQLQVGSDPQCGWVHVPGKALSVIDGHPRRETRSWQRRWSERLPFVGEQEA
jgi:class 3 adenylate cyclase